MVQWTISFAFGKPLLTRQNRRQAILGTRQSRVIRAQRGQKIGPADFSQSLLHRQNFCFG
jgi:hypothetical protein